MAKDKDDAKAKDEEKKKKDGETAEGQDGEGEAKPAKKGMLSFLSFSRKTLMFVVAPAVLGVVVLGAGAYFFLFSSEEPKTAGGEHGAATAQTQTAIEHPTFVDVPEILVNLATTGDKPAYLKLTVSLELSGGEEALHALEPVLPRVVDQFQTYLRELRVEDLSGSAAMFRLKEELLRRVNMAVEPLEIKDVLFKEMIVQ